jgi:hypothetical protein
LKLAVSFRIGSNFFSAYQKQNLLNGSFFFLVLLALSLDAAHALHSLDLPSDNRGQFENSLMLFSILHLVQTFLSLTIISLFKHTIPTNAIKLNI